MYTTTSARFRAAIVAIAPAALLGAFVYHPYIPNLTNKAAVAAALAAALAAHITLAVGWIGAVASYIALDVSPATSRDPQMLRAAYRAMEVIAWYVIVPLALASLLSGVVMSLGIKWG